MTFATTTATKRGVRVRLWLEIAGIEAVLVEQSLSHLSRTQLVTMTPGGTSFGESRLDLDQLAEQGASLTVRLRETPTGQLAALFASRTRRVTWLATSLARGDALVGGGGDELEVASNAGLASSGTLYLDAETFTWTGKSGGTTLTGVTRELYSSRAQDHFGGSTDGAGIWTVPPNWVGRRATLKVAYLADDGTSSSGESTTLGTFRVEAHPQYLGAGEWELRCGGLHEHFANARLYVGQREVKPLASGLGFLISSSSVITLDEPEAFLFALGLISGETSVRLTYDSGLTLLPPLNAASPATITIGRGGGPVLSPEGDDRITRVVRNQRDVASLQHVAFKTGTPARITLILLLSELGDGANHATYDRLPGVTRTDYAREEWRFGAAIPAADIDIASFEAFLGQGPTWTLLLDEEMSVGDLLTEFCRSMNAYWYVTTAGLLAVARVTEKSTSPVALTALDDDDLVSEEREPIEAQQSPVIHSAKVTANYDPLSQRFLTTIDVVDHEIKALFPEDATPLEFESKFLSFDDSAYRGAVSLASSMRRANPLRRDGLLLMLRRRMLASLRTRLFTTLPFGWPAVLVEVGQVVRLTNARMPDFEGSTLSLSDALVVGKSIDLERGIVRLRLFFLDKGFRVAPAGILTSWNAGTKTATLSNTDACGSSPGDSFAAGWTAHLHDVSGPAIEALVIASITATTITFTTVPAFTPAAGDVVFPVVADGLSAAASGFTPEDFVYQVPTSGTLGVSGVEDPRWS